MRVGAGTVALWMALTGLDRHLSGPCVSPCGRCVVGHVVAVGRRMTLLPSRSKEHSEAFRSVSKHFEALKIGRNAPAITAHNYPWRACRADFTTARGGQGSRTVKRRADDATLTAGTAVVTRIAAARRWSSCAWLPP